MSSRDGEALKFGRDHAVVAGGGGEDFARELEARGQTGFVRSFQFFSNAGVVGGIGDNRYAFEVFCGGAQHGGAADVDVFDELFGCQALLGGGGFERVEIYDDEIDRRDAVLGGLFLIVSVVAAIEEAAVNLGMERFYAAAEHLGPAGEVGNIAYGDARFAEEFRGTARRKNFDAQSG